MHNGRMPLSPAEAAVMYRSGMSACEIAAASARITRQGAEARIRAAGLGGLAWCSIHRTYEELTLDGPVYAPSLWRTAAVWEQPMLA
jgi:hypothetical protein